VDSDTGEIVHKTQTTLNGNTSTAIGTGLANSEAIINQVTGVGGTDTLYAAKLCRDYKGGRLNDWFLPSQDELALLYAQRDAQKSGGFTDESYWSSSEYVFLMLIHRTLKTASRINLTRVFHVWFGLFALFNNLSSLISIKSF